MCRWFSIFLLPYVVCIISAQEQEERNSLTRPIHPRRHKRAEQVRLPVISRSPFALWKNDPKCMVPDRDMMSCPKKNADDPYERLVCIEPQALCDDHQDCPGAEDENAHFCMFKKLEDAEMRKIKAEIYALRQNKGKQQPEYKDVVVNNDETSDATSGGLRQPHKPGIWKIQGEGPLAKSKMFQKAQIEDDPNKSIEEEEEEEENDENESEEEEEEKEEKRTVKRSEVSEAIQHEKRRRTYRHLLQLQAISL